MLIDADKYKWLKWQQPVFTDNNTWGSVTATSVNDSETGYQPYHALDGDESTFWENREITKPVQLTWVFDKPLKIYRIELVNKPSTDTSITKSVDVYADEEMEELIISGEFVEASKGVLNLEPKKPISCDKVIISLGSYSNCVGLTSLSIIAEVGEEKIILAPFMNTTEGMTYINNGYNDDSTFSTEGMADFKFNGVSVGTVYISSNHWMGFGVSSEQLKVLRRDGCSTAIYRQKAQTSSGLLFLKIRFEGYTVYHDRTESNRLIFELFLLSNNDMLLNVIQTPTSSNTGESNLICGGKSTSLKLFDGKGGGSIVSFYHGDDKGLTWNIIYDMYEEKDSYSHAYLLKSEGSYYTVANDELVPAPIKALTAAMFINYGFDELPSSEILGSIVNPQVYLWKTGGSDQVLKATLKAYPYPQTLESVIDLSHPSIIGIKMITAEYSGDVRVCESLDNGTTFTEEIPLSEWLNIDTDQLYNSLNATKILILHFILHDNAAISRFKITYIN